MKVVPVGANLVVKRLAADDTTPGGLVLPDSARKASLEGRVLSVGDGRLLNDGTRAAHEVGEGDRVLLRDYSGNEVVVDGQQLLIVSEDDILAIVR